jgi:LacI family transcriptional regulator
MLDDETYAGHQRLAGCRTACREYGVDPKEVLRCYDDGFSYDEADVAKKTIEIMQKYPNTTAILAANDFVALSIASALQDAGHRIPEDISIVGYDDSEALLDRKLNNILTTIRLPLEDIGREAARLLLGRITGDIKEDRTVLLPVSLIQRGSTAPPRPL